MAEGYGIPLTIMVRVGETGEPIELATALLPWPYDVRTTLAPMLHGLADDLLK